MLFLRNKLSSAQCFWRCWGFLGSLIHSCCPWAKMGITCHVPQPTDFPFSEKCLPGYKAHFLPHLYIPSNVVTQVQESQPIPGNLPDISPFPVLLASGLNNVFWERDLLKGESHAISVLPMANKSQWIFKKLLDSALLQFIKQTIEQTIWSVGTSGPGLNPVVGH